MSQHSYAFRLPILRPPRLPRAHPNTMLLTTIAWLGLYGWLGYRLWINGLRSGWQLNLILILGLIVIGVMLVLAWRNIRQRWRTSHRISREWRALSLRELQAMDPFVFEEYVAQRIFARQGYEVRNQPDSKDGGVDIWVIAPNRAEAVVQCKRYRGTVGAATIRELYGTMIHSGVARAFLVTTGTISMDARKWVEDKPIRLIDGNELVQLSRAAPGLASL